MVFHSDRFIFDGVNSESIGIMLVTVGENDVLMDYGIPFEYKLKVESSFGDNPFYTKEESPPEPITLDFCLTENRQAIKWSDELEKEIINWLTQDKFCEFISYDNPELVYYFRATKVTKKMTHQKKGILSVTFQPYYKHPVKKIRKDLLVEGERFTNINNECISREYVYPMLEIEANASGNVEILNESIEDSEPLVVKGLEDGEKIFIDNQLFIVIDENDENKFHKVNRHWLKLKKGTNKIKINGNVNIKIKCNLEIKI
ncbi:phage tail domain-containing protein [Peptostreptococcus faecalis]|uniref:phage tail domain-containing protein n=1 Tax=Peptostreptococcus faecalis TaxID=2045015 RepID=UPI000C7C05E5|nr:phage tail domain-containing protein [Peptostreptococcus faecalis]